ncbi:glutaminyl-peptide cyclotransferase [bacterium]|nr:glutaminyl-peptide cyclotransferase [bacterium]
MRYLVLLILWLARMPAGAEPVQQGLRVTAPTLRPTVVARYPHDSQSFTQGLCWAGDGTLYESSGLAGKSYLRRVQLKSGEVLAHTNLPGQLFGEGLALLNGTLTVLTYQDHEFLRYLAPSLQGGQSGHYKLEGWGLTASPEGDLVASDGTSNLYWLNPVDLSIKSKLAIHEPSGPVPYLNELEYAGGKILANVHTTELIAVIDPATGRVDFWLDLSWLLTPQEKSRASCLNGIAFDPSSKRLYVTGKYWPWIFELDVEYDIGLD